jgi:hypothetical protein
VREGSASLERGRYGLAKALAFGGVPIFLAAAEAAVGGPDKASNWQALAFALIPPIVCFAFAAMVGRLYGGSKRIAAWWGLVGAMAFYVWWILAAGLWTALSRG